MKFICSKSLLLQAVQTVAKAVPSKTTMTILECILVRAKDHHLILTANDMELGIETVIEANVLEEGIIALDAKLFLEIVRKLPDSDITVSTEQGYKTTIICEKSKFNLIGKSGEDFSYLPNFEKKDPLVISQYTLKETIRQTIFSIADNDSNKIMTGELFEINEDELKVASLDGHRISVRKIKLNDIHDHIKVIVPGKTLNEISKILSQDTKEEVTIYFNDNHIIFVLNNTTVVSRLIEGEYFNIDRMISNDYETKVRINKRELLSSIDRATLLVKEGDKKPIIINVENQNMNLRINSTIGSMNEDIDIQQSGKDMMIGFNPKFLIDALRVIEEEEITMYLVNPKAPCFIRNEEGKYIYLVLPVNFNTVN